MSETKSPLVATPPPWRYDAANHSIRGEKSVIAWIARDGERRHSAADTEDGQAAADAELIVRIVNHLSDQEAAVRALAELVVAVESFAGGDLLAAPARDILRRLRGSA